MIVVSDTSPIRALISIGKADILRKLFDHIIIPLAVKEELLRIKQLNTDINLILDKNWIEVRQIKNEKASNELKNYLDAGESETIVLAKEINCELILMDETSMNFFNQKLHT